MSERQSELEDLIRRSIEARGIKNRRVLDALRAVPRHLFVPDTVSMSAYEDTPLPIGEGQTISQPYIVALMTEAAMLGPADRCLEIGTGSGYQTAVLSLLCAEVYSIEQSAELLAQARRNLALANRLGAHLHLRQGDGYYGWSEAAPFNVILVTAATPRICTPLLEQLSPGGRMVLPVGPPKATQRLERWTRTGSGPDAFTHDTLLDVRFVPMLGTAQRPAY
ncbi:MAG TPA: protein-L-isoaspartate(D-aspartate) O-methyltransferase [Polyangiaceae bacterium]